MKQKIKSFLFILLGFSIAIICFYTMPKISSIIEKWRANELLAFFTAIGIIVPFILKKIESKQNKIHFDKLLEEFKAGKDLINEIFNKKNKLLNVDIEIVSLKNGYIVFRFFIENCGDLELELYKSNLYIDKGNGNQDSNSVLTSYKFPNLLGYTVGKDEKCDDCDLAKDCRKEILEYPKKYSNDTSFCCNFEIPHFSDQSIRHLYPKEKHSEEYVLHFNDYGVFRATFVVVDKQTICSCSSKQFVVQND